jgi:hypothetical protein
MNKKLVCLNSRSEKDIDVSSSAVTKSFEDRLLTFCQSASDRQHSYLFRIFSRIAKKSGFIFNIRNDINNLCYFFILMGVGRQSRIFPVCYFNEVIPYCFDCWPDTWINHQVFFAKNNIKFAFFSSKVAANHFASINPNMQCIWLPEATEPSLYNPDILLKDREIDLLEMGRKYQPFHQLVVSAIVCSKYIHLYERKEGEIIFPDQKSLYNGLSNSKVSVCFPASMTHQAKSSGLETVTHRYFESMASKCLIVGHCPDELIELFGYNPVIEAEMTDPSKQIFEIIDQISEYQDLVDRNYHRLLEVGTWETRVQTVINYLVNEYGYTL